MYDAGRQPRTFCSRSIANRPEQPLIILARTALSAVIACSLGLVCGFQSSAIAADEAPAVANSEPGATSDTSASSGRKILQGKTEVVEYRLSDQEDYQKGMAAMERKNYAAAENFFSAGAAQLGEGYEKYRAECLYFQGKALVLAGRSDTAVYVFQKAVALFDQYDPSNPYKLAASKQYSDLSSGRAKFDSQNLTGRTGVQVARVSIDQQVTLASGISNDESLPHMLEVKEDTIPKTVHNCFAEMTCLETAELGSNIYNAVGRWQPLMVENVPAAFATANSPPVVNVRVSGRLYRIALPQFRSLRKIMLVTDNEKVCAVDLDNFECWLLRMDLNQDLSLKGVRWAKLVHKKAPSDSSVGISSRYRPTGGVRPNPNVAGRSGDMWGVKPSQLNRGNAYGNVSNSGNGYGNRQNVNFRNSAWGNSQSAHSMTGWGNNNSGGGYSQGGSNGGYAQSSGGGWGSGQSASSDSGGSQGGGSIWGNSKHANRSSSWGSSSGGSSNYEPPRQTQPRGQSGF